MASGCLSVSVADLLCVCVVCRDMQCVVVCLCVGLYSVLLCVCVKGFAVCCVSVCRAIQCVVCLCEGVCSVLLCVCV